jgi:tRNA threonylcarbamoyladenosine biosynthesis protein TsaE
VSLISNANTLDIVSHSATQTQRLGTRLGELAQPGDLFCLQGNLGAGKTCFVQGIGQGLNVAEAIHSPTFILANEHHTGRLPLYHLDVYRMAGAGEAMGIGLDDYLYGDGVCVIEWAEKIKPALPNEFLWIEFRHVSENKRGIVMRAIGARYEQLLADFKTRAFAQGESNAVSH